MQPSGVLSGRPDVATIGAGLRSSAQLAPAGKPPNALHNPVTLPVVCQLMLLRSNMGARSVT